jgi:UDP-N-acetyl-2-amino-2-deoxyglucuronate dehydrogenase
MSTNPKNFAIIGVAGYIAVRHLKAIKETGNNMNAALDVFDSVGVIDQYFPNADFFVEFERFDRHLDKLKRKGKHTDYVSICSPNYLHDSHIRFALRQQANAICEKPMVLNPWNVDALQEFELETGRKVFNILQLRLHPSVVALKERIQNGPKDKIYDIDLTYITSRGNWYFFSWKGEMSKSGGVATNIGVHFFDMLSWIFGDITENIVHISRDNKVAGFLRLKNARVRWLLSVDYNDIPENIKQSGQRTYRSLKLDGEEFEFSEGFTDLHTKSYEHILSGHGFGIDQVRSPIETVYNIRNAKPVGLKGDFHPLCKNID